MTPPGSQNLPPKVFMGSKSALNLTLMPNLLSDYVGYRLEATRNNRSSYSLEAITKCARFEHACCAPRLQFFELPFSKALRHRRWVAMKSWEGNT